MSTACIDFAKERKRRTYHTDIKLAASFGLLPEEMKTLIPKSSLHRFTNTDYSDVFGISFTQSFTERLKVHKFIEKNKKLFQILRAFIRIQHTIIKVKEAVKNKLGELDIKSMVIKAVEKVKKYVPLNRILFHFKVSVSQYYVWLKQVRMRCLDSPLGKCLRVWPNQLTKGEVKKMKALLTDPAFKGWPVKSIAWHAIDNDIVTACMSTWYKYVPLLGITRPKIQSRRKKNKTGIRASNPHEIWHADVTIFRTLDNVRWFIYILMDNFSRYILAWKASLLLSGKTCLENIREGYNRYILPNKKLTGTTSLIMDGGPENENQDVDGFVQQEAIPIEKIIAQKDIIFSNSMVEASHKILKYRFLFHHEIPSGDALIKHLEHSIPVYNNIRPHGSRELNGLTPLQRLNGITRDYEKLKEQFKKAHKMRVLENRKAGCGVCS